MELMEVLHVTPGPEFEMTVAQATAAFDVAATDAPEAEQKTIKAFIERTRKNAADKYFRRLGIRVICVICG